MKNYIKLNQYASDQLQFKFQMIKIEIRMAETGHSQIICLNQTSKGSIIFNHIYDVYKVLPKDQLLITKIGTIIKQEQTLQNKFTEQKGDKTITHQQERQSQIYSYQRIPCIYFFNLKQINKSPQIIKPKSAQYWMDELQQKLKISKNLKSHIYEFKSFDPFFACEKNKLYESIVKRINDLRKVFVRLQGEYQNLKDLSQKIEQIVDRCSYQRKSGITLLKSLQVFFEQNIKQDANNILNQKKMMENSLKINGKNIQQNSSFLQNKYSLNIYFSKIGQIKKHLEGETKQIKQKIKQIKSKFRTVDEKATQFGKNSIIKKLKLNLNENKVNYENIIALFEQLLKNSDPTLLSKLENQLKQLQKNALEQQQSDISLGEEVLRQKYKQFSEFNEQNRIQVKFNYEAYITIKNRLYSYKEEITQLSGELKKNEKMLERSLSFPVENIQNNGINGNKDIQPRIKRQQMFEVTASCQIQLKRRIFFNRILSLIHTYADRKCTQEQLLRRQFTQKNTNVENTNKTFLKNVKVPFFNFVYDQTTDLEVIQFNKSLKSAQMYQNSASIQQFVLSQYDSIWTIISNIDSQQNSLKIQNLKEIIKRMSGIFAKVYDKKYLELQQKNGKLCETITNLDQNIHNLEGIILQHKNKLIDLQKIIDQKQEEKIVRIREFDDQLKRQKYKCQKVNNDLISLKKELIKQTSINSTLCEQLAKCEQENQIYKNSQIDLKKLMELKQGQIQRLETQLSSNIRLKEESKDSFNQSNNQGQEDKNEIDLKVKVMQNFSKGTSQIDKRQILRLNQQIIYLQSQNEQLQDQFDALSAEMRKIIMKETEDKQIQTEDQSKITERKQKQVSSFSQINNDKDDRITIDQEIGIGQNAIFMPFANNVYVGVHNNDEDKTLCNMNTVNANNYLLDFRCFHPTTKDLLNQCSFLVILKVTKIFKEDKNSMVQGKIKYLLGFEDNSFTIKNYSSLLPSQ